VSCLGIGVCMLMHVCKILVCNFMFCVKGLLCWGIRCLIGRVYYVKLLLHLVGSSISLYLH